jgi:3D (Asp-Asp-Asp) domain-containing protein
VPFKALLVGALGLFAVVVVLVVAVAGASSASALCAAPSGLATGATGSSGSWLATAYGPPWGGIQGDGVTATGINLTAGPAMYEVAVDPSVIALGSYVYVQPNPFGTTSAFYAGDTGGAIKGDHVDIYDWRGRADQDAWGTRQVTVTPAPTPGAGNLLGDVPISDASATPAAAPACVDATVGLSAAQTAQIEPDGSALAPASAPAAVQQAIAAGNAIHTYPYPVPDVHYGSLAQMWPAYDCSGATSFVLYEAGLLGPSAGVAADFETYGLPGPGRWISLYANSTHVWIVVAGIALDTAEYGGAPVPAGSGPRWRVDPLANLEDGEQYVVRHPPGL